MLSAGLDRQAARWWPVLQGASDSDAAEGWALLSIGAPSAIPVSESRIRGWAQRDESARGRHRAALLVAALAGLGRLRSEEHTSELQSLMRSSYAGFCLQNNKHPKTSRQNSTHQQLTPQ